MLDRLLPAQDAHVGVDARHTDPAQRLADVHLHHVAVAHHVEHKRRAVVGHHLRLGAGGDDGGRRELRFRIVDRQHIVDRRVREQRALHGRLHLGRPFGGGGVDIGRLAVGAVLLEIIEDRRLQRDRRRDLVGPKHDRVDVAVGLGDGPGGDQLADGHVIGMGVAVENVGRLLGEVVIVRGRHLDALAPRLRDLRRDQLRRQAADEIDEIVFLLHRLVEPLRPLVGRKLGLPMLELEADHPGRLLHAAHDGDLERIVVVERNAEDLLALHAGRRVERRPRRLKGRQLGIFGDQRLGVGDAVGASRRGGQGQRQSHSCRKKLPHHAAPFPCNHRRSRHPAVSRK